MIGTTVSHFRVLEPLGRGGMGEVWLAQDTTLERLVALKFMAGGDDDPQAAARFLREARAAAALNHPHICTIFETGEFEGRPFIAMEYLQGRTLRACLNAGRLEPDVTLSVGLQLADALTEAHSKGILHRDLKPENVFVGDRTTIKLLDFGLAKSIDGSTVSQDAVTVAMSPKERAEAIATRRYGPALPTLTQSGVVVGTVTYMSPEQIRGEPLDRRSDLFSLGTVLYESVTGRPAFRGDTTDGVFKSILNDRPPSAHSVRPEVPESLSNAIDRLLEKEPEKRFDSAPILRDALMGSTVNGGVAVGSGGERLPTLGVKRSSLHAWIATVGVIGCVEWLAMRFVLGQRSMLVTGIGIGGLALLPLSVIVWRISRTRERHRPSGKLVRFQALPDSQARSEFLWRMLKFFVWASFGGAAANAYLWLRTPSNSHLALRTLAFIPVFIFLMWLLLRARGWRTWTRSRWHRSLELEVEGSYAQVLARCSNGLAAVGAYVTALDLEIGHIEAQTSTSTWAWGERITFDIRRDSASLCTIALQSDGMVRVQATDWGKNVRNLRTIAEALVQ